MFKLTWLYVLNSWKLNLLFYGPKRKRELGMGLLVLLGVVSILFTVGVYAMGLAEMGLTDRIPLIFLAACTLIIVIEAMFEADSILFQYADYDLQVSLPIARWKLVGSRLLVSYLFALLFSLALLLPSGAVYAWKIRPGGLYWPTLAVLTLTVPLLPTVLGTLLGGAASVFSARFRRRGAVRTGLLTAVTVGLLGLLYTGVAAGGVSLAGLPGTLEALCGRLERLLPQLTLAQEALCGRVWPLGGFVALSAAVFLAFSLGLGRYYTHLRTLSTAVRSHKTGAARASAVRTPFRALMWREWKHYFSFGLWVGNTAFGSVLILAASAAAVVVGGERFVELLGLPEEYASLLLLSPLLLSLMANMSCVTASSISLEGDQLWQLKALPVETWQVFQAKLLVNLGVTVPPCLVGSVLLCVAFRPGGVAAALFFVTPLCHCLMSALLGLAANLWLPKLQWQSQAEVVKQSAAMAAALFGGMLLAMLPMALAAALSPVGLLAVSALLALAVAGLSFAWLRTGGVRKFADLN